MDFARSLEYFSCWCLSSVQLYVSDPSFVFTGVARQEPMVRSFSSSVPKPWINSPVDWGCILLGLDGWIWVFPKIGGKPPKWRVKIMENPIKMDDLGVPPFKETPIWMCTRSKLVRSTDQCYPLTSLSMRCGSLLRGRKLAMVMNHLLTGMILHVEKM